MAHEKKQTNPPSSVASAADLLDRWGDSVLRLAFSYVHNLHDAEDILQETLIRYIEKQPVFPSEKQEKAWLLQVAANLSKDVLRRRKIRSAEEITDDLPAPDRSAADLDYVWEAVGQLPLASREVIHLYYNEGYSTQEIADILGMKASTVRSHLKRGRDRLREILRKEDL